MADCKCHCQGKGEGGGRLMQIGNSIVLYYLTGAPSFTRLSLCSSWPDVGQS